MIIEQALSFSLTIGETLQLVTAALAGGGLITMIRIHTQRINALEGRCEKIEGQFLGAIEKLGENFHNLTTELKTVVAVHESRIDNLEKR